MMTECVRVNLGLPLQVMLVGNGCLCTMYDRCTPLYCTGGLGGGFVKKIAVKMCYRTVAAVLSSAALRAYEQAGHTHSKGARHCFQRHFVCVPMFWTVADCFPID